MFCIKNVMTTFIDFFNMFRTLVRVFQHFKIRYTHREYFLPCIAQQAAEGRIHHPYSTMIINGKITFQRGIKNQLISQQLGFQLLCAFSYFTIQRLIEVTQFFFTDLQCLYRTNMLRHIQQGQNHSQHMSIRILYRRQRPVPVTNPAFRMADIFKRFRLAGEGFSRFYHTVKYFFIFSMWIELKMIPAYKILRGSVISLCIGLIDPHKIHLCIHIGNHYRHRIQHGVDQLI